MNDRVAEDTGVRTGGESRSELTFADLTITRLGANTIFSFNKAGRNAQVDSGSILLRVPKESGGGRIRTNAVTVAVTGTTVIVESARREEQIDRPRRRRANCPGKISQAISKSAGRANGGCPAWRHHRSLAGEHGSERHHEKAPAHHGLSASAESRSHHGRRSATPPSPSQRTVGVSDRSRDQFVGRRCQGWTSRPPWSAEPARNNPPGQHPQPPSGPRGPNDGAGATRPRDR